MVVAILHTFIDPNSAAVSSFHPLLARHERRNQPAATHFRRWYFYFRTLPRPLAAAFGVVVVGVAMITFGFKFIETLWTDFASWRCFRYNLFLIVGTRLLPRPMK